VCCNSLQTCLALLPWSCSGWSLAFLQCSMSQCVLAGALAGYKFGSGTDCECPHFHQTSVTIICRILFQVKFLCKSNLQILLLEGAGVSVSYLGLSDWPWETLARVLSWVRQDDVHNIILMIFISYFGSSCGVYALIGHPTRIMLLN
jgi:hypothetical protein